MGRLSSTSKKEITKCNSPGGPAYRVWDGSSPQNPNRNTCDLFLLFTATLVFATSPIYAQAGGSPWENAVNVLQASFTGPIAKGLALVSIVVGGLMFAFGEGGSKRMLSGIVFGVGMAIGAVNFMGWLFP